MHSAGPSEEAYTAASGGVVPRLPPLLLHAFCADERVAACLRRAAEAPVLSQLTVRVRMGGIEAAERFYAGRPTPHLMVLQSDDAPEDLLHRLDHLAEVCDPETRVLVIGNASSVDLYRELMRRGVSGYLSQPVDVADIVGALARIEPAEPAAGHPRSIAFIGARGGAGSSMLAQNLAFLSARLFKDKVVLADLDPAFGTAALNFDLSPQDAGLIACSERLSLLALPHDWRADPSGRALSQSLDAARRAAGIVMMDVPHGWNATIRNYLKAADAVVVTTTPDLAGLRNVAGLVDALETLEPALPRPWLVINQVGAARAHEIPIADFAEPGRLNLLAALPYAPSLFAGASARGRMLAEAAPDHPLTRSLTRMTHVITGRVPAPN
ncbi:CtpF protein [Aureimonas sp. OT7]|uniref:CtpF protein n=1 Tax=Aureimonas sp. OT7 TaxID=2816454 RepID=UPI0017872612|nr:CtpF protein [Aureimonas sp. OT7]QOG06341.1 CtpF protein [Aureimonas sp. OT7]